MIQHPTITRMEALGLELPDPRCPLCGDICEVIYRSDGEVIGCDNCISSEPANECSDCFGGLYGEI